MSKIHLVSLTGVHLDRDLIPFWIDHYKKFGFDSYYVYLHGDYDKHLFELYRDNGMNCTFVSGTFSDGSLRVQFLHPHIEKFPDTDYVVTVDSDEFHEMPDNYADIIREHDFVLGEMFDRWGDSMVDALPDKSLKEQYPYKGDFYGEICNCDTGNRWFRRKIMANRVSLKLNLIGSHMLADEQGKRFDDKTLRVENCPYRVHGVNIINHYSYRSSILERMLTKTYFTYEQFMNAVQYFKVEGHPAVHKKFEMELNLQKQKGWVPA